MTDAPTSTQHQADRLVRANQAWIRTLAGNETEPQLNPAESASFLRARADCQGLWSCYHDPKIHASLATSPPQANTFLTILERARVWAWGSRAWPGVAHNLQGHFSDESLEALAWEQLSERPRVTQGQAALVLRDLWPRLIDRLGDQETFGREVVTFWQTCPQVQDLDLTPPLSPASPPPMSLPEVPTLPDDDALVPELVPVPDAPTQETPANAHEDYRVYSTAFERTVAAESLMSPAELGRYHRQLEQEAASYRPMAMRLARRLMRQIMAWQRRTWTFD